MLDLTTFRSRRMARREIDPAGPVRDFLQVLPVPVAGTPIGSNPMGRA